MQFDEFKFGLNGERLNGCVSLSMGLENGQMLISPHVRLKLKLITW